jgi:hypothetical protein
MRVEVLEELDPDDPTLEIPWSDADRSVHYVDLKERRPSPDAPRGEAASGAGDSVDNLARIEDLEECRAYPPLALLLCRINSSRSPLRSVKCDAWITTELGEDERLDYNLPFKMGSYVDVVFDQPERNGRAEPFLELGDALGRALSPVDRLAQIEVVVRRCLFHPEEQWGCYATIFTHAYGTSREEARREWTLATGALCEALDRIFAGRT